jgi:hypothetical protein
MAGVTYDGVAKELTISPRLGSPFRGPALVSGSLLSIESAGPCPGVITVRHVDGLPLTLTSIRVDARGCLARVKVNGAEVNVTVEGDRVRLGEAIKLRPGDVLEVSLSTTG